MFYRSKDVFTQKLNVFTQKTEKHRLGATTTTTMEDNTTLKKRGRKKKVDNVAPKAKRIPKRCFSTVMRGKIKKNEIDDTEPSIICIKPPVENECKVVGATTEGIEVMMKTMSIKNDVGESLVLGDFTSEWKNTTSSHCWSCCHPFTNTPVGMPVHLDSTGIFRTRGVFCGFACIITYSKSRKLYSTIRHLIVYMYKVLTGNPGKSLQGSPPVECLEKFGGNLSIEEFRGEKDKIFEYISYPMQSSRDYIQAIDLDRVKCANDYIFKGPDAAHPKVNRKVTINDFLKSGSGVSK